jgi:2-methylcitrate dehydratase PrpD
VRAQGIRAADVARIVCPVAEFNVSIVCEPVDEKCAPGSQAHGRVCLQYTLAEALWAGELGRHAYGDALRTNPDVLALARRVEYRVDPDYPGPGRFTGAVHVTLADGREIVEVEEHNRGSASNPMSEAELRAKFDDNASGFLDPAARQRLAETIERTENLGDASRLVTLAIGQREV